MASILFANDESPERGRIIGERGITPQPSKRIECVLAILCRLYVLPGRNVRHEALLAQHEKCCPRTILHLERRLQIQLFGGAEPCIARIALRLASDIRG